MSPSSASARPAESALASLNAAQCRAVTSKAATVAILAGPGSGKTHTLTSRVVWLVDEMKYQPSDVIVATFTVKAAKEMKHRISKAMGEERARRIVLGTFHGIARRYLVAYGKHIGLPKNFNIADAGDTRAIIQRICKRLQSGLDPAQASAWISKKKSKGTDAPVKKAANGKLIPDKPELLTCFQEYQDHLQRSNLLDYDDLLTTCVELLKVYPACVANVQAVLIDEYQDTNGIQYELMRQFAQARNRITIVGDPDQSIYGWRSAEIKNLFRLLRDFPHTDEISLEENYRSSQAILDASLKIIQQDTRRYQKVLLPTHNKGTRPVLRILKNVAIEADWIVSEIKRTILLVGSLMKHDDIAILLRSASISRYVESALGKAGIPYKMIGGLKFFDRAEIKILIDYLRVISQPHNNDAVARIVNVPRRGIGDQTIKLLLEEAEVAKMSVWTVLTKHCRGERTAKTNIKKAVEQKLSAEFIRLIVNERKKVDESANDSTPHNLVSMLQNLLSHLDYEKYIKENYPEDHENRWANVLEFLNLAGDFIQELAAAEDEDKLPDIDGVEQVVETDVLDKFLSNIALASEAQKGEATDKPQVTISTIHAAKGLEWPIVFVPAAYNGSIPHARSEDLDEERRLLYVAMTRAKSLLYISCPKRSVQFSSNGGGETELSPFLPKEVHSYFAKRGPSFNSDVITEMGRILGREALVPTAGKIFENLPLGERLEDDMYPLHPDEVETAPKPVRNGQWPKGPRAANASRIDHDDPALMSSVGMSTTMDSRSSFTMASLPGFTTAAAHQTALVAVGKDAVNDGRTVQIKPRKGERIKRPLDQPTMFGFIKRQKSDAATAVPATPAPPVGVPSRQTSLPAGLGGSTQETSLPPIASGLTNHRLAANKFPRPAVGFNHDRGPTKAYPNFSSSPPRENKAESDEQGTSVDEDDVPQGPRDRPANCLHVTTATMPQKFGGFTRPAMARKSGGVAPIDRLRKPFKPLTVNRGNAR
jgi:DNA helicase-2/ATP-dependent DNA helicase PcrA